MYLLNIFRASVCLLSSQQALKNMTREESRELTSIRRKFIGLWSTWSSLKEKEMAPNVGASTPVLLRNNKIIYIYNFFFFDLCGELAVKRGQNSLTPRRYQVWLSLHCFVVTKEAKLFYHLTLLSSIFLNF
jgi:hypothetical protein